MSEYGSPMKKESTAAIHRKNNKPLMEKRRRARINNCLTQLKGLVLEALKKDTSRFSKLEKADILEMTVKHLRSMQRQQMTVAMATDTSVLGKYRAGFNECANEISRYLGTIDGLDTEVRARLLCHLSNCVSSINTSTPTATASQVYQSGVVSSQVATSLQHPIQLQIPSSTSPAALPGGNHIQQQQSIGCVDPTVLSGFQTLFAANGGKLPGAVQLMPAAVPGGVALVLPAGAIQNFSSSPNAAPGNGLVYGNYSTVTNFAISPMQNNSPLASPASSVSSSSHSCGQMSPVSSIGSPAQSPSPKVDINQNAIPQPAEVCVKDESMWRPW